MGSIASSWVSIAWEASRLTSSKNRSHSSDRSRTDTSGSGAPSVARRSRWRSRLCHHEAHARYEAGDCAGPRTSDIAHSIGRNLSRRGTPAEVRPLTIARPPFADARPDASPRMSAEPSDGLRTTNTDLATAARRGHDRRGIRRLLHECVHPHAVTGHDDRLPEHGDDDLA